MENSDIIARAERGGNIDIKAQGIFGLKFGEQLTLESDITSSGTTTLDILDVDPSEGLVNLLAEVIDASNQIVQNCSPGRRQWESEFVVTGRGGLPPNPSDVLSNDAVWIDLGSTNGVLEENRHSSKKVNQVTESNIEQIVEATGWAVNDKGQVVLTASNSTELPSSSERSATECNVS